MEDAPADPAQFEYGSYGMHELLHTLSVFSGMWDRYVVEHPSASSDEEIQLRADRVSGEIAELYQLVGSKHLPETAPHKEEAL